MCNTEPSFSDPVDTPSLVEPVATISASVNSSSILVGLVAAGHMMGAEASSGGVVEVSQCVGCAMGFLVSMGIVMMARYLDTRDRYNNGSVHGFCLLVISPSGALLWAAEESLLDKSRWGIWQCWA